MKTSICNYGGQQVKSNQHLDICLVSTQESKWEGGGKGVISMQQAACCISAVLMWWSRPEHRQTALSSSPPLCTVPRPATYHGDWGATDVQASCMLCLHFPRRQRQPLLHREAPLLMLSSTVFRPHSLMAKGMKGRMYYVWSEEGPDIWLIPPSHPRAFVGSPVAWHCDRLCNISTLICNMSLGLTNNQHKKKLKKMQSDCWVITVGVVL